MRLFKAVACKLVYTTHQTSVAKIGGMLTIHERLLDFLARRHHCNKSGPHRVRQDETAYRKAHTDTRSAQEALQQPIQLGWKAIIAGSRHQLTRTNSVLSSPAFTAIPVSFASLLKTRVWNASCGRSLFDPGLMTTEPLRTKVLVSTIVIKLCSGTNCRRRQSSSKLARGVSGELQSQQQGNIRICWKIEVPLVLKMTWKNQHPPKGRTGELTP